MLQKKCTSISRWFTIVIVSNKGGIVYLNHTKQKIVYYVAKKFQKFGYMVHSMYVVLLLTRFLASFYQNDKKIVRHEIKF